MTQPHKHSNNIESRVEGIRTLYFLETDIIDSWKSYSTNFFQLLSARAILRGIFPFQCFFYLSASNNLVLNLNEYLHEKIIVFFKRWEKPGHSPAFGYDFWYQPRHKTMVSSSWGAPAAFSKGFDLQHVADGLYGRHLNIYSWPGGELKQTLDLGESGLLPLEVSIGFLYL